MAGWLSLTSALAALFWTSAVDAQQAQQEGIVDPVLRMTAYEFSIPSGWLFEGAFFPGNTCVSQPYPVFRAYSHDGLSEIRLMPRFDWSFTNNPSVNRSADCLPLQHELSAAEFLDYVAGTAGVTLVGEMQVPPQALAKLQQTVDQLNQNARAQAPRLGTAPMTQSADMAAKRAEYRNGSFTIEERLVATTLCSHLPDPVRPQLFYASCSGFVSVVRAPKGKLDALVPTVDAIASGSHVDQAWNAAYMQGVLGAMQRQNQQIMGARQAQFDQAQRIRQHESDQFIAQLQAKGEAARAQTSAQADARQAAASDWVDYALDRQTVTGSGGTVHISSAYNQTWSDGAGNYYQTNDLNANPNGSLPGNWSLQTQVHGDGSPMH